MKSISLLTALMISISVAHAKSTLPITLDFLANQSVLEFGFDLRYQIGDEWGKKPVTAESLNRETPAFQRAARATAKMGGGTAFYLGKFHGHHVMATNHHVLPAASSCLGNAAVFPYLKRTSSRFNCIRFFGEWSDVDLALFEIEVKDAESEEALSKVAKNFAFHTSFTQGRELLTIGFGIADNAQRVMVANQDSDCVIFSQNDEFRFMADPDEFNPADYKAWSFANGCDVSHGDSGSAMVDRNTSEVLGLIWTGRIPKSPDVQHSDFLKGLMRSNGAEIWTELSFSVPAPKILEQLQKIIADPKTDSETRATLADLTAS